MACGGRGVGASRVAVALSGGVDSALAAALLLEQGCQVEAWTMRLWQVGGPARQVAEEGIERAVDISRHLGIAHHLLDLSGAFHAQVVDPFLADYASGRTPNPCVRCNQRLKFGALLDAVQAAGCRYLATGHYARIQATDDGYRLLAASDARKDQSYFLYGLQQRHLAALLFPLGEMSKDRVRSLAAARGLPALRRESQDVCFLVGEDYRHLLEQTLPGGSRPGPIYDTSGRLLGRHRGLPRYTVGQREGLGISAARPLYVLRIDVAENALVVGPAEQMGQCGFALEDVTWVDGAGPADGAAVHVRVRHRAAIVPARLMRPVDGPILVALGAPRRDIAPGQAAVFYAGEQVLGGGTIGCVFAQLPGE